MGSLSESRKADRKVMADAVQRMAHGHGWACERQDAGREISLRLFGPRGLTVRLDFDGAHPAAVRDLYCMPWNSDDKLSHAFEEAMGSPVNPYHRLKCTTFAAGFERLVSKLERAMEMAADGTAFEGPENANA